MKVSIVVPAFNEERLLPASLQSIKNAAEAFPLHELIVCDNNSTDRTAEIARSAGARVVFEPVNRIGRARNAGAAAASGEWLLFVDADSFPSRELFADVARAMADPGVLAGGATLEFRDADLAPRIVLGIWNRVSRAMKWAAGSLMFCQTSAFRRTGGFSDELYASEELDLYRRLKRMAREEGRRIVIVHAHPLLTSDRKVRLYGLGEMSLFMLKMMLAPRRTLRSRADCHSWYDGRR